MLTIEYLLECDYETLKWYIVNEYPDMLEFLKNLEIKKKLINPENKYELIWLAQEMPDQAAILLFDDVGLEILRNSSNLPDKMNGIMTCGKEYVTKLVKNDLFCSIIMKHYRVLNDYVKSFSLEASLSFVKYIQKHNPEMLKEVLLAFSFKVQTELVKELELPIEVVRKLIISSTGGAAEYLLKNDFRIVSINDYTFQELFTLFSKNCHIPSLISNEPDLIIKLSTIESIKDYRFLINALAKHNDTDVIEQARKRYYEYELQSYDANTGMLKRYYDFYLEVVELMKKEERDYDRFDAILCKYFNLFGSGSNEWYLKNSLSNFYASKNYDGLEQFLIKESNLQLSNIIVDYHFEDIPYNFFLDIRQLIHFQEGEGRTLSDVDLDIYNKLLNIDSLSYEEKMNLHQRLLQEDWISKHYDIFRGAKDKAASLIKEQMLTPISVQKFYDEQLSAETGVPIYVLDGDVFFAFVKSLQISKNIPLEPIHMASTVDGCSYSLDGSSKLDTYKDPKTTYNLIFGDFPISQVVHMYPVDSYSKYVRTSSTEATKRVYELYTPTEFVEKSGNYNEIVLSQRNMRRVDDEVNDNLELPTILGIYCYDEFTELDIESAKNLGVGIVLVKTMSYDIQTDNRLSMMDTLSPSFGVRYLANIDYLFSVHDDDMINRR